MTSKAKEHFQAGELSDAVAAQAAEVKSHPASTDLRGFLCELLAFGPDMARVDKHLDVMGRQDPKVALGVAEFRQVVQAEQARRECFKNGAMPSFIGDPTPLLQKHLRALTMLRAGEAAGAVELLAECEEARPKVSGTADGQAFEDFRDLDDTCAAFWEVLTTTGKYFWIPTERVQSVEFAAPNRARDLVWRQAQMSVEGGPEGVVYVPALYPATHELDEERVHLGRATEWLGGDGEPVRGAGQRMLMFGEEVRSILEVVNVSFGEGAGGD